MMKMRYFFSGIALCLALFFTSAGTPFCQTLSNNKVASLIKEFKKDPRGPYQAIRWFCPDGSVNPADRPCPQPGGIQHALPKDIVRVIEKERDLYLGQILAGSSFEEFFDEGSQNSRLKQYQVEKYLKAVDDGWILRRARYYRGALQDEDESAWGKAFLTWLLSTDEAVGSRFFLVRKAVRDIPHRAETGHWKSYHADSVLVWGDVWRRYILTAMVESDQGEQIMRDLVEVAEGVLRSHTVS